MKKFICQKEIMLKNQSVLCEFRKNSSARNLNITIKRDGRLLATVPRGATITQLELFINKKAGWIIHKIAEFKECEPSLLELVNREEYLKVKEDTKKIIEAKLNFFNQYYNLKVNRISIKMQKSRWGSCSRRGYLNFNYKIFFLPERLVDYIVIHELCHLKEFNHSQRFWDLVGEKLPDYRRLRRELRNT